MGAKSRGDRHNGDLDQEHAKAKGRSIWAIRFIYLPILVSIIRPASLGQENCCKGARRSFSANCQYVSRLYK